MWRSSAIGLGLMLLLSVGCRAFEDTAPTTVPPSPAATVVADISTTSTPAAPTRVAPTVDRLIPSPFQSPTAIPPPSSTPAPSTPEPYPPLSPAYLDPESAVLDAIYQLGGTPDPMDPDTQLILNQTIGVQFLYHLDTAAVGEFNADTTGFDDWLVEFVRERYLTPSIPGYQDRLREHMEQQYSEAVFSPDSRLAQTLAIIELGLHPTLPSFQEQTYLSYVLTPAALSGDPTQNDLEALAIGNEEVMSAYTAAHTSNPPAYPTFVSYLRESGYVPPVSGWTNPTAGARDQPTPVPAAPSPTAQVTLPQEGDVLITESFAGWPATYPSTSGRPGWMEPYKGGYLIGVYGGTGGYIQEASTSRNDLGDISASVSVRELSIGADGGGCVSIRHAVATGAYSVCMLGSGRTWAAYHYVDASGVWQFEELFEDAVRTGTNPSSEWNTLKIVAQGKLLWFIANDTVLGWLEHNARSAGAIAVSVINWDTAKEAEFEFSNLVVRAVQ